MEAIIQNKIYKIRGQKIMLNFELAEMYGVTTANLNEAVKRNIDRFPSDFMFQLTDQEFQDWKSQFATSNSIKMGMRKKPYAFTELGVATLSTVISSQTAIEINRAIMCAFVTVRQLILNPPVDKVGELQSEMRELKQYFDDMFSVQKDINEKTKMKLKIIRQSLAEMQAKRQTT